MSPEVGELDQVGFERALSEDADGALELLADLMGATDVKLRELARRLAGRVVLDLTRAGRPRGRGVGRLVRRPATETLGDLDLDSSLDALLIARAAREAPNLADLVVNEWSRPELAVCLLVDRSGSMGGDRLATAALAAAACAWRAPGAWSLLAFSNNVLVIKGQQDARSADSVIDDVFCLRGFGPTDVSLALRSAHAQLETTRAGRKLTVLLSDCRPTAGDEPALAAGALDELVILAPAGDAQDARALAAAAGARCAELSGPAGIPAAFAALLDG